MIKLSVNVKLTQRFPLHHTTPPCYKRPIYDADLVHSLLQYVPGVFHQLLHLSEHVVQTDRAPIQRIPQDHRSAARRAAGRPQQVQSQRDRQQRDTGHLLNVSLLLAAAVTVCPSTEQQCDAPEAHRRTQLDPFYLESLRNGGWELWAKMEQIGYNSVKEFKLYLNDIRPVAKKEKKASGKPHQMWSVREVHPKRNIRSSDHLTHTSSPKLPFRGD